MRALKATFGEKASLQNHSLILTIEAWVNKIVELAAKPKIKTKATVKFIT